MRSEQVSRKMRGGVLVGPDRHSNRLAALAAKGSPADRRDRRGNVQVEDSSDSLGTSTFDVSETWTSSQ